MLQQYYYYLSVCVPNNSFHMTRTHINVSVLEVAVVLTKLQVVEDVEVVFNVYGVGTH
jgi:hypothetical protein